MGDETAKRRRSGKPKTQAAAKPARKARGFLRVAELTTLTLKSAGAKRGFAELRLLTEWRSVVGEALADVCRPVKVTYRARGGVGLGATLVVTAEGARSPEIEMQKTVILDRVNAFYGYRAVSRLLIDQSRAPMMAAAPAGLAEDAAEWRGAPVEVKPAQDVTDQRLALALGRLEANIKTRKARAKADLTDTKNARSDT